jgi:type IV secretion system protein TrbL
MDTSPIMTLPEQFAGLRDVWFPTLFFYANKLFFILATIEMILAAVLWVVHHESLEGIVAGVYRKILWFGFMYAVLFNAQTWIPAIIASFIDIGQQLSGMPGLNPGEIMANGVGLAVLLIRQIGVFGILRAPASLFAGLFAAFGILLSFAVIAIETTLTLIESYIVTGAGVLLLGFAPFRGTFVITERFLGYVVAVGLKLFTTYLIVSAGAFLAVQWGTMLHDAWQNPGIPLSVMVGSMLFAFVAWRVPRLAASLATGAVGFTTSDLLAAATLAWGATRGVPRLAAPLLGTQGSGNGGVGGNGAPTATPSHTMAAHTGGGWSHAPRDLTGMTSAPGREAADAVPRLHPHPAPPTDPLRARVEQERRSSRPEDFIA